MKKRILFIALIISLIVTFTACQGMGSLNNTGEVVKPGENSVPEITILATPYSRSFMELDYFRNYKKQFEKQYGVKLNYIVYGSSNHSEADTSELMAKLIEKNGPDILIDYGIYFDKLIKLDALIDVREKIPNASKVYDSFIGNEIFYIPFGMQSQGIMLNKDMLQQLNIPTPTNNWNVDDYYKISDQWSSQSNRIFTRFEFYEITQRYLSNLHLFDYEQKKAYINTQELKAAVADIRKQIFSGNYTINPNYDYKNYYAMLFETSSPSYESNYQIATSPKYKEQVLRNRFNEAMTNVLYAKEIDTSSLGNHIVLPNCLSEVQIPISEDSCLWTMSMAVNRNGTHLELAYEFINGLLSDDVQMSMFEDKYATLYPVNNTIEKMILDKEKEEGYSEEAINLKQFILNKIKSGEYVKPELNTAKEKKQYEMLIRDLSKFIFTDKEYSDAELSAELQKLEDKYNIWLSE